MKVTQMDIGKLRIFYEVAKAGSFTAAAEVVHLTQSAVSRAILNFEDRLGIKLFIRHIKGLTLTPEGEQLYEFACRMVEEAQFLERVLQDRTSEVQGSLKIVTTPHIGGNWLMQYLPGFLKEYPKICPRIIGRADTIDPSMADAVIRTAIPHHPNLVHIPLTKFPMGLFASKDYINEYGMPQTPQDLDHHRLLTMDGYLHDPYTSISWILEVGASCDGPRRSSLQISTFEGLVNAAHYGLGIAELSKKMPNVRDSDLVPILPQLEGPIVEIFYIYSGKLKQSKRVASLGEYLHRILKEEEQEVDTYRKIA